MLYAMRFLNLDYYAVLMFYDGKYELMSIAFTFQNPNNGDVYF